MAALNRVLLAVHPLVIAFVCSRKEGLIQDNIIKNNTDGDWLWSGQTTLAKHGSQCVSIIVIKRRKVDTLFLAFDLF